MQKKGDKVKFSVLIPVYYKEKPEYLSKSLTSILNNTLKPSEILLIEDGKLTRELDVVIEKFKKRCNIIKIVKFDENRGLGFALADGVKLCKYNLIARMDSDDICHSNRFEKQINYLNENDVDIVGSSIIEYDNNMTQKLDIKNVPVTNEEIQNYILKRNPLNHMSVCFKKNKVLDAGNYLPMDFFEDYYLWCRMLLNGAKFYNFEEPLMDVRAGLSMVNRRGGIHYIKCIYKFEISIYKLGLINKFELIKNLIIRSLSAIIPNKLRLILYKKKLRKRVMENE